METSEGKSSCREWNLDDEYNLLDAISHYGYGNWSCIAKKVSPHSPEDCEQYYLSRFAHEVKREPALCSSNCRIQVDPVEQIPLNFTAISEINDFITKTEDASQRQGSRPSSPTNPKIWDYMVALPSIGYNRVRSDFDIECDNNAECVLALIGENHLETADMDEEETHLFRELQFALYQSFNDRLRERHRCKKIVRDHCLMDQRKTYNTLQRLDVGFGKTTLKSLIPAMRFHRGPEFDFLVEKLKYQNELRIKIALLKEYRRIGIKYLNDVDVYQRLNNQRLKYRGELAELGMASHEARGHTIYPKKPMAPLVLAHLPGYSQLSEEEKDLCSTARIVPRTYLGFKEALVAECKKHDGLRLAQARNLIRIDVNKTRKIYDYLVSLNMVWPPLE